MNRKQRRLQEKKAGKTKSFTGGRNPEAALELKAQAMSLKNKGLDKEAIPLLTEALRLDPGLADVHFTLAMMARTPGGPDMDAVNKAIKDKAALKISYKAIISILNTRKQYDEALVCQQEICRLFPDDLDEKSQLAVLMTVKGQKEESLAILAEVIEKAPDDKKYKAIFTTNCANVFLKKFDPAIKRVMQRLFDNIYESNLLKTYSTWISLVLHDPASGDIETAQRITGYENLAAWLEGATVEATAFLREPFFLDGLRLLIIADPVLESFLVNVRRWLCLNAERLGEDGRIHLYEDFLLAMAEQCFFNEYIYPVSPEEQQVADRLTDALNSRGDCPLGDRQIYALSGCYAPTHRVFPDKAEALRDLSSSDPRFAAFAKTLFFDVLEEKRINKELPSFGRLDNEVSKRVREQYEENPYPRWTSVITYPIPIEGLPVSDSERFGPLEILIAGCGTGRQAIDTAATYPQARITAIDLSRASLSYAQRKANEAGLGERIRFIHADILDMDQWDGQFDLMESSGVLHHMEDPFKGWQTLTKLLKPGGHFKIGLYSEAARKAYVEAQNFAKENGFPPTIEGLRACRSAILALPTTNEMRKLVAASYDFYTASLVRDLLFHVQEHRYTLPQIKEMMDRLGLACTRFVISDMATIKRYDKMFPDDLERRDMLKWHLFEQKFPLTFTGMYQFWCRKSL